MFDEKTQESEGKIRELTEKVCKLNSSCELDSRFGIIKIFKVVPRFLYKRKKCELKISLVCQTKKKKKQFSLTTFWTKKEQI